MSAVIAMDMWHDMFALDMSVWEKVLRTVLVYLGIAVIVRIVGKRLMAQMNSLDLVVVLLLSNVVQNAIIGNDNSVTGGLLGALVLVGSNAVLDRAEQRWPAFRRLFEGRSTTVITDGRLDERAITRLGVTRGEVHNALRHQGADHVSEVQTARLEPGGTLIVDLRREDQPASYGDLLAELTALRDHVDARLDALERHPD